MRNMLVRSHESDAERIDMAYRLCFSREPTEAERSLGAAYLAKLCGDSSAKNHESDESYESGSNDLFLDHSSDSHDSWLYSPILVVCITSAIAFRQAQRRGSVLS
ncbi:MAG: hypothetical protein WD872_12260 [Pirellulaceae bacterium]